MQIVTLETLVRRAPLGLRFTDIVRDLTITDGLLVRAQPLGTVLPPQEALRSPVSGIYGFRQLPGLRGYTYGLRPASDWCVGNGTPEAPNFVITVTDQQGRFLPQLLLLCLPRTRLVTVPLYSSPARAPLGGYAVVRGELWHNSADAPAAWAVVTATPGDFVAVADARGLFTLFLPVPALSTAPAFDTAPLDELQWPLTFEVLYAPATREAVLPDHPPTTASIVGQAAATVFDTPTGSGAASVVRNLVYGQELVVATAERARLLVEPV